MYCSSDRFTYRQLNKLDSQLSKIGFDICKELEKKQVFRLITMSSNIINQNPNVRVVVMIGNILVKKP